MRGQEQMLAMHFIMNLGWEGYGKVIEQFDQTYLSGDNNYPKKLHNAYTLLKNWTRKPQRKHMPRNLGLSFNIEGDESGNTLANDSSLLTCARCGHINHTIDKCYAKTHSNGTVLHLMGNINKDEDHESNGSIEHVF